MDQLQANVRRMFENPFAATPSLFATIPQAIGFVPPVEIAEADDLSDPGFLAALLPGARPVDPAAIAGTVVLLALVAAGAAFVPARRATRVDALVALRTQ